MSISGPDLIAGMDWVIEELLQQSDEADLVPDHQVSIESPFQQAPGQVTDAIFYSIFLFYKQVKLRLITTSRK